MRTCVQRGLYGVLLAGGIIVLGADGASASDRPATPGLEPGSQLGIITASPQTAAGSVVGDAALSLGTSIGASGTEPGLLGNSSDGLLNGVQISPEITVPVNISDNSVSVIGNSASLGESEPTDLAGPTASGTAPSNTPSGSLSGGILNGNVISPEIAVPVNISGSS